MELKRLGQPLPPPPPKKVSCQEECKRLFEQKALRDGITTEKCIADACHVAPGALILLHDPRLVDGRGPCDRKIK